MDKLIESLRETLSKLGLDPETIEAALQEAVANASEEDPQSGDPLPVEPVVEEDPQLPPEPPVEEAPGELLPSDEPSAVENPVEPTEGEPVPPTEPVPPVEPTPALPPFDPTELLAKVDEVTAANAELQKANEGLLARVQALEEALKNAGVIDGGENPTTTVGDPLPSAAPQNPTADVFGDVLRQINSGKRF